MSKEAVSRYFLAAVAAKKYLGLVIYFAAKGGEINY